MKRFTRHAWIAENIAFGVLTGMVLMMLFKGCE